MLVAEGNPSGGEGDVNFFVFELFLKQLFLNGVNFCGNFALKVGSYFVCKLTDNGSFLGGKPAHLFEYCGQLSLFAEEFNSD